MLVCVCLCPHISPTPGMQVSYMILQRVSPVTHSIGNCVKRVAVIVASVIVFRNPMPLQNTIGECELVAAARLFLGSCQVASLLCSGLGVGRFLYCMDCIACFVLHVLYCVYCIACIVLHEFAVFVRRVVCAARVHVVLIFNLKVHPSGANVSHVDVGSGFLSQTHTHTHIHACVAYYIFSIDVRWFLRLEQGH